MVTSTTRAEALRSVEGEISVLMRRLRREMSDRARLIQRDLQGPSYFLLGWIAANGPVRASTIAEAFEVDKGALSRQLQHLAEHGLLERVADPADGRATLVSVSAEAVRRLESVEGRHWALRDEQLADWSADELTGFAAGLRRYNGALG